MTAATANPQADDGSGAGPGHGGFRRGSPLTGSKAPFAIPIVRQTHPPLQWGPSRQHSSEDSGNDDHHNHNSQTESNHSSDSNGSSGAAVVRPRTTATTTSNPQQYSPGGSSGAARLVKSAGSGDTNPNQATSRSNRRNRSNGNDGADDHAKAGGETLWERAEHYFSFSPAQAALLFGCHVDSLTNVWDESEVGACTAAEPATTNGSPPARDGLDHEAADATASKEPSFLPNGISRFFFCGGIAPCSNHSSRQQQLRHPERVLVLSRTHEDIEVTPGHNVQVRLPPTDPILSSSSRGGDPAKSSARALTAAAVTQPQLPQNLRLQSSASGAGAAIEIIKENAGTSTNAAALLAYHTAPAAVVTHTPGPTGVTRAPILSFEVKPEEAAELERSISELTMRSSYASTNGA